MQRDLALIMDWPRELAHMILVSDMHLHIHMMVLCSYKGLSFIMYMFAC